MNTRRIYMVYNSLTTPSFSVPKPTPNGALKAAENQISSELLRIQGVTPNFKIGTFGEWIRTEYPHVVQQSYNYMGEIRKVEVPIDITAKSYRKWYCQVYLLFFNPIIYQNNIEQQTDEKEGQ